jgi:hypothetical protein
MNNGDVTSSSSTQERDIYPGLAATRVLNDEPRDVARIQFPYQPPVPATIRFPDLKDSPGTEQESGKIQVPVTAALTLAREE